MFFLGKIEGYFEKTRDFRRVRVSPIFTTTYYLRLSTKPALPHFFTYSVSHRATVKSVFFVVYSNDTLYEVCLNYVVT